MAGVSTRTVSRVTNETPQDVAESTRNKINAAMANWVALPIKVLKMPTEPIHQRWFSHSRWHCMAQQAIANGGVNANS
ncbi:LacI family DNA-binding transcriptional regulator [Vibrio lentus]|nr:LacI family DNA-binding transcriptional regulator [Vibrio lentus]